MTNHISYSIENGTVYLDINGEQAGYIKLSDMGGAYQIEKSEIDEEYRGKGYYKGLLLAAIQLTGAAMLISNERNENSNRAYISWTGNDDLEGDQQVNIYVVGEKMFFDIDEE